MIPSVGEQVRRVFRPTQVEAETMRMDLRKFWKGAWPHVDPAPLVWNWHLDALCDHLSAVTLGEIRFLMVNVSPRTTKSLGISVIWPVWEWLHDPTYWYLTASYALQLSIRDTLRSRRLMDSEWFQRRYGHRFRFAFDEKLKRQYANDKGGRRLALAVDSATTGEGGNRLIVDDPHNATEAESDAVRIATHDWWDHAMSSRLNDPDRDAWVLAGQRVARDDLFGHVMDTMDMSQVVHLVLPNEFESKRRCITRLPGKRKIFFRDPRKKEGELMCPQRISAEATKRLKRTMKVKYALQYQQDPDAGGGAILARKSWRLWEGELPELELLLSSYDTAFEEGQENDYSARTDWGIFSFREPRVTKTGVTTLGRRRRCIILLGAWRDKVSYHVLKRHAKEHYEKTRPDYTLIEKKGTGTILCQDLRRAGIRGVRGVKLDHGGRVKLDKVERANLASVVLDDGLVYYVERLWAKEVIDECTAFPGGNNDDYVDTVVMAWQFLRRMNEVELWEAEDEDGDVRLFKRAPPQRRAGYG